MDFGSNPYLTRKPSISYSTILAVSRHYAEAGIKEYWVVNLKDTCVHVFRDPVQGIYTTEFILTTGTIAPLAFPDIQVQVQRLMSP
ncbi:MAG: Uma2 family endonuclease [Symploca sp. SIO2E6]|nr:Uma2 family endonuclease [Symploca sp. SIO2E6]